jgi:hypothetical protein
MIVTHAASTPQAGSSVNEGVVADVSYVGVGAGRLALLFASIAPETQAPDSPVDDDNVWTLLGQVPGGDPAHVAPTDRLHMSRIAAWWTLLDGTEAGDVTITSTPAPNTITGCMGSYISDTGTWEAPVLVSGNDAAHGAGRAILTGSLDTAAGDMLVAAWSSDTEVTTAITAPSITQAGATIEAATLRSRTLNTFGSNSSIITADAAVTVGASAAVAAGFSGGGNNCGPGVVVRLRAASAGPSGPYAYVNVAGTLVQTTLKGIVRIGSTQHPFGG